jgi:hypothetical protein
MVLLCNDLTDSSAYTYKAATVILPRFITLSDDGGRYLEVEKQDQTYCFFGHSHIPEKLYCKKLEPDANCTFEVIRHSDGRISLKGPQGNIVHQMGSLVNVTTFGYPFCPNMQSVSCEAVFDIVRVRGNQIYFHASTPVATFMTSRQLSTLHEVDGSTFAGNNCLFTVSEPIVSKEIVNIDYDLPTAHMLDVPPIIALNTIIRNDSESADVQQTLAYSYQRSKVGTWNNTAGIELGVATTFSAEVPFISSVDLTVSFTESHSREWGGSNGTEETVTSSTQITVPPGKKGKAIVLVKRKAMDITFRCKEKIIYKNGTTQIVDKDGVYRNVESYAVDVQVRDWEDA